MTPDSSLPPDAGHAGNAGPSETRLPWQRPAVVDLPPLANLTLQTGAAITGTGSTAGGAGGFSF